MEILIIIALTLLNGVFAMSEIAVVSARKARLEGLAKRGSASARRAFEGVANTRPPFSPSNGFNYLSFSYLH